MQNPGESGHIMQKHVPIVDPATAGNELRILKYFVQNIPPPRPVSGTSPCRGPPQASTPNAFTTKPFTYTDLYSPAFVKTTTC